MATRGSRRGLTARDARSLQGEIVRRAGDRQVNPTALKSICSEREWRYLDEQ
jgi:hypothetical protein